MWNGGAMRQKPYNERTFRIGDVVRNVIGKITIASLILSDDKINGIIPRNATVSVFSDG